MATDIRGLYENNRRREVNAVTSTVPYVLEPADLREGTAEVVVTSGDYLTISIPSGCVVTAADLVIESGAEFGTGSTAAISIGGSSVIPAHAIDVAGLTVGTTVPVLIHGDSEDVVITVVAAGTSTEDSVIKVVIEYIDYTLATMSFIGVE